MNKLGCHVQRLTVGILDWIELAQPRVVVWLGPSQDGVDEIRRRSPGTFVVGRKYERERDWQSNAGPYRWADECAAMAQCDAWICWNEPFGHDAAHLFGAFDEWMVHFRERMLQHGMEAVAFNFGTGNFTAAEDRVKVSEAFPRACAQFRYFGVHEYHWPDLPSGLIWHVLRFPAWYDDIGRDDVEFVITECGLTQAVHVGRPDRGWQDDVADAPSDEEYLRTLAWYNERLCRIPYVMGAAVFNWGGYGWETFEHADHPIRFDMAKLDASTNGGGVMDIKVYDMEYKERDWNWAVKKYGVGHRKAAAQPGQKVYRLVALQEQRGNTSLKTKVLDEDGQPLANVDVAFYWPGAPDPPDPPTDVYGYDWHGNFVHGPTNVNGDVGPGMGTGAYHGEGEGGPHAVWVRDPEIRSDICEKLGMLAGTFHDHLDQTFQLVVVGNGGTEPEPGDGELELEFLQRMEEEWPGRMLGLAVVAETEAEKAWLFDTRGEGTGPGVDELIDPQEWIFMGMRCLLVEVCCDFEGNPGEEREYSISLVRLENGHVTETLIEPVTETVKRLGEEDPRRSVYVYRLVEGIEPPPGPSPEPEEGDWVVDLRVTGTIRRR